LDKLFDKLPYENLEDIDPLHIFAGAAGVGVLLFVIAFFTLIGAVREEYGLLEEKKVTTERTLGRYEKTIGNKDQIFRKFVHTSGKLSGLKRQMPTIEEMPQFLRKITAAGKVLDMEILDFEIREGEIKDYYTEIPVKLKFRGELWNTMDFFETMQNMLRVVDFDELTMNVKEVDMYIIGGPASAVEQVPLLHTNVVVRTYVYLDGAEDKVPEKKAPEKKEG